MEERQHETKKWEGIVEVLPDIYRIPVPLPGNPLKELNSYVIRGKGNKNLLVDTGFRLEACRKALIEGLDSLGISMEDINGGYMGNNHYVLPLTVEMVEKIKKMPNVLSVNHQEDDGQIFPYSPN